MGLTDVQTVKRKRGTPIIVSEQKSADEFLVDPGFVRNGSRIPTDQRSGVGEIPDVARLWGQDVGHGQGDYSVFVRVNGCRSRHHNGEGEGGEDRGEELHR